MGDWQDGHRGVQGGFEGATLTPAGWHRQHYHHYNHHRVVTKITFAIAVAPFFENHYPLVVIFPLTVVFFTNDRHDLQKEAERLLENETNENLPEGQLRAQVKILSYED